MSSGALMNKDAARTSDRARLVVAFGAVPDLPQGWRLSDDPTGQTPFDAVILNSPIQPASFLAWLHDSASPLSVVIDLVASNLARADIQASATTTQTLAAAFSQADAIVHRLADLGRITSNQDRDGLIILGLALTRQTELVPVMDPARPALYGYRLLDGIADATGWLGVLSASGLMTRRFHDRVYLCGECQSARIIAREVCTACKSSNITEETLVHHYRCGAQGPRSAFSRHDALVCPKCNSVLRHFGVDYDTPGQITTCASCGGTASEPEVAFLCSDCGKVTAGSAAQKRDWFAYRLTEAGEVAAIEGRLPGTRLSSMMSGVKGWRAPHEMAMLLELCQGLHTRYQRPFTAVTLCIADPATIISQSGRTGLARLHHLIVDLVGETVRTTDGVAILGERIIICLPETPSEGGPFLIKRLKDRFESSVAFSDSVKIAICGPDEIVQLITELART